jgi:hypothetical protein
MSPYLIIGGVSFLVYAGIRVHDGINAFISPTSLPNFELIIANVCFIAGFVSMLIMLILIAIVYKKRVNQVIGAIVFLVLFLTYELIIAFVPGISYIYTIWGNVLILLSYSIIRGIAANTTNNSLRLPIPGYGSGALGIYGWSFLITTLISIIAGLIADAIYSVGLMTFALIVPIIQYFLDALCLLIIAISFILNAVNNPSIKGQVFTSPTTVPQPTTYTTTTGSLTTTLAETMDEPQQIDTPADVEETKPSERFCSNCGAEYAEDSDYCTFCGEVKK